MLFEIIELEIIQQRPAEEFLSIDHLNQLKWSNFILNFHLFALNYITDGKKVILKYTDNRYGFRSNEEGCFSLLVNDTVVKLFFQFARLTSCERVTDWEMRLFTSWKIEVDLSI